MIDEVTLMAYADGELDADRRRVVEQELGASPALAARLASQIALRKRVAGAWSGVLAEPTPERLRLVVTGAPAVREPEVVDLGAVRRQRRRAASRPAPGAAGLMAAACLAAGLVIGFGGASLRSPSVLAARGGALVAQDGLARALNTQLVAAQSPTQPIRIGFTVRGDDGRYCRTFVDRPARLAGLACRTGDRWTVPVAAAVGGSGPAGAYRVAGDEIPAPVLDAAQAVTSAPALDAPAELAARELGWR
jgi:hypothetical protein